MPQFDFTFQESSPFISYSGGWNAIYDHSDLFRGGYNGIFRPTSQPDATAKLSFFGTGVSIFGAKRENHGNYSVVLDNGPSVLRDGFAKPYIFNTSLWSANGLPLSQHTVTLTNKPIDPSHNFVDIDFITIQRSIGGPDDTIHNLTLDNTADFPSVNYTGSWQELPQGSAYNNSLHRTAEAGAKVILQFRGCCIEVYGQYANAELTALLDNQKPVTLRGFDVDLPDADQQPQTLLYLADNLDEETVHKVTLTNVNEIQSRPFYFDYAVVSSTKSISPVDASQSSTSTSSGTSTPNSTPSKGNSQSGHVQAVTIALPAVLGTVAFALIVAIVYYLIRCRRKSRMNTNGAGLKAQPYILPYANSVNVTQTSAASGSTVTRPSSTTNAMRTTNETSNVSRPAALSSNSGGSGPSAAAMTSTKYSEGPVSTVRSTSVVLAGGRGESGTTRLAVAPVERELILEQDAGAISVAQIENAASSPSPLPPAYDSNWNQSGSS